MQSVYVFTSRAPADVRAALATLAVPSGARQFVSPSADRPLLRIDLEGVVLDELEPEPRAAVVRAVGSPDVVCITIDVSRQVGAAAPAGALGRETRPGAGAAQSASQFVAALLARVGGVAMDDHSERLWTEAELRGPSAFAHGY